MPTFDLVSIRWALVVAESEVEVTVLDWSGTIMGDKHY